MKQTPPGGTFNNCMRFYFIYIPLFLWVHEGSCFPPLYFPAVNTAISISLELSPRGLAGWHRLHSQNPARQSLHNHRGGLLALCSKVKDPRARPIRTVSGYDRDEAAARSWHTSPANQSWTLQPAQNTHLSLSLQEGHRPQPLHPSRQAERSVFSLSRQEENIYTRSEYAHLVAFYKWFTMFTVKKDSRTWKREQEMICRSGPLLFKWGWKS